MFTPQTNQATSSLNKAENTFKIPHRKAALLSTERYQLNNDKSLDFHLKTNPLYACTGGIT